MLQKLADVVTWRWLGLQPGSHLGEALNFFIYDSVKIFLLLAVIVFVIAVMRSYFLPERTRQILSHRREYVGNLLAALLGILTPFLFLLCGATLHRICRIRRTSRGHFFVFGLLPHGERSRPGPFVGPLWLENRHSFTSPPVSRSLSFQESLSVG